MAAAEPSPGEKAANPMDSAAARDPTEDVEEDPEAKAARLAEEEAARLEAERLAAEEAEAARLAAEAAALKAKAEETAGYWVETRKLMNLEEIRCAVVWLHGQGELEVSWQDTLASVQTPEAAGPCRWIWPRATLLPCSTRGGVMTAQWFDIPEFPICRVVRGIPDRPRREEDPEEVTAAVKRVHAAIAALEAEGVPAERIVVAGFGQGAGLAAHAVLRYERLLAGCALLSGWLPCREALAEAVTPAGSVAEIFWCHGARDRVVEPQLAAEHARWLKELGANVQFRLFPELAFQTSSEELSAFTTWLAAVMVAGPAAGGEVPETEAQGAQGGPPPAPIQDVAQADPV